MFLLVSACSSIQPLPNQQETGQVQIDQVEIKIGVGSPIPVEALIYGTMFDTCAQFSNIEHTVEGHEFRFNIEVQKTQDPEIECLQDSVSFTITVPLNMVNRPAGEYIVIAHNVSASFIWPPPASDASSGSINGWVWHDLCASGLDGQPQPDSPPPGCIADDSALGPYHADGVMTADEQSIGDVVVSLGEGACPSTGLFETKTIVTDLNYSFAGLAAGTYCVSIDPHSAPNLEVLLPGEWTYPEVAEGVIGTTVELAPGENKFDVNFGWDYQFKPDA